MSTKSERDARTAVGEGDPTGPSKEARSNDALRPESLAARIAETTELLEAIADDRGLLAEVDVAARVRLLTAAGRAAQPTPWEKRRLARAAHKKRRDELKRASQTALAGTGIRQERRRLAAEAPPVRPPLPAGAVRGVDSERQSLPEPRACYVCKSEFSELHFFYDAMCPECADLNWRKRHQRADLSGRVALVTGGRVKIGYQATLMLLRSGAEVVATTRFPRDAAGRYATESDFADWRHRLHIVGLDLRHVPSVEAVCEQLVGRLPRLDFLLNNACQTVRRPPGFYRHLMAAEGRAADDLDPRQVPLLGLFEAMRDERGALPGSADVADSLATRSPQRAAADAVGLVASAALSQLELTTGDCDWGEHLFPSGRLDMDLQQVDLRQTNSWRLGLAEVSTVELLEVHLVNAVAPFVLSARLKPLMLRHGSRDKHIVNVSAMEGQFYRTFKTDRHPHTNMAKAALNMMTRTSAADYIKDGIHMNSVDTGWITDEDPALLAAKKTEEHGFHPPLDSLDGAARICDPILAGIASGEHVWGLFLKDYKPTHW